VARILKGRRIRVRTLVPGLAGLITIVALHSLAPLSTGAGRSVATDPAHALVAAAPDNARQLAGGAQTLLGGDGTLAAPAAPPTTLVAAADAGSGAALAPAAAPPPARNERPPAPPSDPIVFAAEPPSPPPPPPRSSASGGGVWAVVIGINDYPGSNDLQSAVNDANDVDQALAGYRVPGNQRLLLRNGAARSGDILAAADWLVANAGPQSIAVFFYAGHVRQVSRGVEGMVGSDGRVVTDSALASRLRGLAARQAWITIAGCFGGGFTEVLAPSRILVAAAPAGSYAYENAGFGRSYLVEYMVRRAMLNGYAPGSVQQAYAWAYEHLQRDYPNRLPVAYDQSGAPVQLGPSAPTKAPPPSEPGSGSDPGSPPPPAPPPTTTTTTPPSCRGLVVIGHNCS
jgi:hypothetical protein